MEDDDDDGSFESELFDAEKRRLLVNVDANRGEFLKDEEGEKAKDGSILLKCIITRKRNARDVD